MTIVEARGNRPFDNLVRTLTTRSAYRAYVLVGFLIAGGSLLDGQFQLNRLNSEAKANIPDAGMPGELTYAQYLQTKSENQFWADVAVGKTALDFSEVASVDELQRAKVVLDEQKVVERDRRHFTEDRTGEILRRLAVGGLAALATVVVAYPASIRRRH